MALINPKVIICAAILIAILLIAQVGTQAALRVNPAPDNPSPFQNIRLGDVDKSICDKIQQVLGNKDPCKWSLDSASGVLKLMVGERVVSSMKYIRTEWAELDQVIRLAIQNNAARFFGREVWKGYAETDVQFQNLGIGTYVLRSGESILRSGIVRLILDGDNWLEYNNSIPQGAINIAPQLFIYAK